MSRMKLLSISVEAVQVCGFEVHGVLGVGLVGNLLLLWTWLPVRVFASPIPPLALSSLWTYIFPFSFLHLSYRSLAASLDGAGLKLDDVRNEWHPDVQTAISRLSPEELSNRNKRIKRAMDLSLKHSELSKEAQVRGK